jgi:hypothetical protein
LTPDDWKKIYPIKKIGQTVKFLATFFSWAFFTVPLDSIEGAGAGAKN